LRPPGNFKRNGIMAGEFLGIRLGRENGAGWGRARIECA
jgi:hypothetical protein